MRFVRAKPHQEQHRQGDRSGQDQQAFGMVHQIAQGRTCRAGDDTSEEVAGHQPGQDDEELQIRRLDDSAASPQHHPADGEAKHQEQADRPAGQIQRLLGLCRRIVDLVSSGDTLRANGLVEIEHIADITSRLAVNRAAWKTRTDEIGELIEGFRVALANAGTPVAETVS